MLTVMGNYEIRSVAAREITSGDASLSDEIRTKPYPTCILCGAKGELLYSGQRDRWFGAAGSWDLKKCPKNDCGLIWLDPMPLAEDIVKAYTKHYYTHDRGRTTRPSLLRRIYTVAADCHIRKKFGYPTDFISGRGRLAGMLLTLFPSHSLNLQAQARYIRWVPGGGRILDVGCGSGGWLLQMRQLGWQVEGVDFDPDATEAAAREGLTVRRGSLEEQHYPSETFDVVTMNHSIEHVPDPLKTIKECARILKSGGQLALGTPNNQSRGHRYFKQDWIGIDPPRHLHTFSRQSMRRLLAWAGFPHCTLYPVLGEPLVYGGFMLRQGWTIDSAAPRSNLRAKIRTRLFDLVELCQIGFRPAAAENMLALAVKP